MRTPLPPAAAGRLALSPGNRKEMPGKNAASVAAWESVREEKDELKRELFLCQAELKEIFATQDLLGGKRECFSLPASPASK